MAGGGKKKTLLQKTKAKIKAKRNKTTPKSKGRPSPMMKKRIKANSMKRRKQ